MKRALVFVLCTCCAFLALVSIVLAQNVMSKSTLCEAGCLLPPTGLIGWWPGDGNADDIQLGTNGIPMNGVLFVPGLVKQTFSFDGVDDFVDVPDTPALHAITVAITVCAWINPQTPRDGEGWIFGRRDPNVSEGISLAVGAGGVLSTYVQTTDAFSGFSSWPPVIQFDGQWKHVAVSVDTRAGKVRLYLNGQPVVIVVVVGPPTVSGRLADVSHLFIGQRQALEDGGDLSVCRYKGLMDEVEVYNRALSASEIQAIFSVGARGKCKPRS